MPVFAVLLPQPQPALVDAINEAFPGNTYPLSETQMLVSSTLTVYEISKVIKLYDQNNPGADSLGNGVIFATSSYYGKASPALWDWLKAKLEARQVG